MLSEWVGGYSGIRSLFTASYLWWIGSRPVKNVVYDVLVDGEITFWGLLICASSLI